MFAPSFRAKVDLPAPEQPKMTTRFIGGCLSAPR
jgi:hypothetical protein